MALRIFLAECVVTLAAIGAFASCGLVLQAGIYLGTSQVAIHGDELSPGPPWPAPDTGSGLPVAHRLERVTP